MSIRDWFRRRAAVRYLNSLPVEIPAEVQAQLDILRIKTAEAEHQRALALAEAAQGTKMREQNASRPSRCWPVHLEFDGLEWTVRLPADNPRLGMVGRGACPEQALVNFDLQWYGNPPQ